MMLITQAKQLQSSHLFSFVLVTMLFAQNAASNSLAQEVATDITSSGLSTVVGPKSGNQIDITEGTRPNDGRNLFHSFGEFNVGTGDIANFLNNHGHPTDNILSRVTGDNPSNIFGTLKTTGFENTNLFLMNPKGIVFGPNASLNISGSFYATTANSIELEQLPDGTSGVFHSSTGEGDILTSAPPEAFGFLGDNPPMLPSDPELSLQAGIEIRGLNVSNASSVSFWGRDAKLGETGLVVEGVKITGTLQNLSGEVILASMSSAGEADFGVTNLNTFSAGGQITMAEGAKIDTQGSLISRNDNGGNVVIHGGRLLMTAGATIITSPREGIPALPPSAPPLPSGPPFLFPPLPLPPIPQSKGNGGNVTVTATEAIIMSNTTIATSSLFSSGGGDVSLIAPQIVIEQDSLIGTSNVSGGTDTGPSGNVELRADQSLSISDSTIITSARISAGNAGDIKITAPAAIFQKGTIDANADNTANAGNIELNVTTLTLTESEVSSSTEGGTGQASTITIQGFAGEGSIANTVRLQSDSSFKTFNNDTTSQSGGIIEVHTNELSLIDGSELDSRTVGEGQGGMIKIIANEKVLISGTSTTGIHSHISAASEGSSTGEAGVVEINTKNLTLNQGGFISTTNTADGQGGSVVVQGLEGNGSLSTEIFVEGKGSGIFSETQRKGKGGDIALFANNVTVTDQGTISALSTSNALGAEPAGNVMIHTNQSILLDNGIVSSEAIAGTGGALQLEAGQNIELKNQALVSAKSSNADAGEISFTAGESILMMNSTVLTEASGGDGGNINFSANNLILVDPSLISSSVGSGLGGNISLNSDAIVFQASDVFAKATGGQGGNISMFANTVLQDPFSRFDATAGPAGINGQVDIQAPIQNLNGTIAPLPASIIKGATLYSERCVSQKGGQFSSFVQSGKDGITTIAKRFLASPLLFANKEGLGQVNAQLPSWSPETDDIRSVNLMSTNKLSLLPNQVFTQKIHQCFRPDS